jgi:peptidoglycan/xylan/chitin deacetylase (PgdA/CDA1 family)
MYHEVSEVSERNKSVRSTNPAYSLTASQFRGQAEWLHRSGHETLTLTDLLEGKTNGPGVVLTFDDGFENNYTHAFPILAGLGQRAVVFVVTGFVGQDKYMGWEQLREMSEAGFSIQSHTESHRPLTEMSETDAKKELKSSKRTIEDRFGAPVHFLSAPHGRMNGKILAMAAELGYRGVCTSKPVLDHIAGSPCVFGRINVSDTFSLKKFERVVRGNRATLALMKLNKFWKDTLKSLIGYDLYRSLYRVRYAIRRDV